MTANLYNMVGPFAFVRRYVTLSTRWPQLRLLGEFTPVVPFGDEFSTLSFLLVLLLSVRLCVLFIDNDIM